MKAKETDVLNLIGGLDKVFIIPPFQRNYEWDEKECKDLFDDIVLSCKTKKSHYLGNVVYYPGENNGASYTELILVDGQQRITTILLLLCALRDKFVELKNEADAKSIDKKYLKNDTGDNRFRVRLKQTQYDSKNFTAIIDKTPCDSDSKLIKNYNTFVKLINESEITPKEIYETIPKLEVVDVNLQIVNDLNAVQVVFEKINSTGKPLTAADLIRNYLLISGSSVEQENLYKDYWVNIEKDINNDNISRFARDYLIMKIFEDVPNDEIYTMFKEHFNGVGISHKEILEDMCQYSKYYAWLKFYNSPDSKINKNLKMLNFLKTDDLYPLYLFLLKNLFDTNKNELNKILFLLVHFMLRYRIVSPSGGGGALRAAIQQLLEGLSDGTIPMTYDSILYELSNSPAPASRYPENSEFADVLKRSVNTTYARLLLLQIEEHEKLNVPVDLDKVTIEHLMPQTLSSWWKSYLGGEEASAIIYDRYINCIGNLAPISQGYNTKNSNNQWSDKRKNLKQVQFGITSEVASFEDWKETDITKRNDDIAKRACEAIIGPIKRTRSFQTQNSSNEFSPGVYPISDVTTPMEHVSVRALVFNGVTEQITTWRDMFNLLCQKCYEYNKEKFSKIVSSNLIHKSTATKNYPMKDPLITQEDNKLVNALKVIGTEYFTEGALSSKRARIYSKQLLENMGDELINKCQIELE